MVFQYDTLDGMDEGLACSTVENMKVGVKICEAIESENKSNEARFKSGQIDSIHMIELCFIFMDFKSPLHCF
jgi:hypothetical protein